MKHIIHWRLIAGVFAALSFSALGTPSEAQDTQRMPSVPELFNRLEMKTPLLEKEADPEKALTKSRLPLGRSRSQTKLQFVVDPSIGKLQSHAPIPSISTKRRSVGVVRHQRVLSEFVEGELFVVARSEKTLRLVADKIGAKRLASWKLSQRSNSADIWISLISLDPFRNPVESVLKQLEEKPRAEANGIYQVSSELGLTTIATALELETIFSASGLVVGVNWVMPPIALENLIRQEPPPTPVWRLE